MKALTLWQPWASLVAAGIKSVETRSWSTNYRGPLAIHAAKRPMTGEAELRLWWDHAEELVRHEDLATWDTLPLGKVVATCTLVDVLPIVSRPGVAPAGDYVAHGNMSLTMMRSGSLIDILDQVTYGDFRAGRFAWLLADVKVETPPIGVRGGQRLWNWDEQR